MTPLGNCAYLVGRQSKSVSTEYGVLPSVFDNIQYEGFHLGIQLFCSLHERVCNASIFAVVTR